MDPDEDDIPAVYLLYIVAVMVVIAVTTVGAFLLLLR